MNSHNLLLWHKQEMFHFCSFLTIDYYLLFFLLVRRWIFIDLKSFWHCNLQWPKLVLNNDTFWYITGNDKLEIAKLDSSSAFLSGRMNFFFFKNALKDAVLGRKPWWSSTLKKNLRLTNAIFSSNNWLLVQISWDSHWV